MTLSNLCRYTCVPVNQAINPFGIGKLVPEICRGVLVLLRRVRGSEVGG